MFEPPVSTQKFMLNKVLTRDSKKFFTQHSKIGSHLGFKNRFSLWIQKKVPTQDLKIAPHLTQDSENRFSHVIQKIGSHSGFKNRFSHGFQK